MQFCNPFFRSQFKLLNPPFLRQKIELMVKPHAFLERDRMLDGMRKTATSAGLRAVGSAPATGAVFRALAENPERVKSSPRRGKVSRAIRGAPSGPFQISPAHQGRPTGCRIGSPHWGLGDGVAQPTAGAVGYSLTLLRSFMGRADEPSARRESQGKAAAWPYQIYEKSDRIKPDQTTFGQFSDHDRIFMWIGSGERARHGRCFPRPRGKPGALELIPPSGKLFRATAGCGGAAGNARGGRAPQLIPAIRAIRTPHSEMENYQTNPIFLEQAKSGFNYDQITYNIF
ncbi:MAG TPA: hypothetical protein VL527_10755 [Dongiaceae bacterium]|nr:hypothetical protein [Dongiaceae bacterium]